MGQVTEEEEEEAVDERTGLPLFTEGEGVDNMLDVLKCKCQLRLIIANASVWGVSGRYGYGWDCVQMQLCSSNTIDMKSCMFQDDDEEV
jgi:hypothetical protein